MIVEEQGEVIDFLSQPSSYPDGLEPRRVERIDTHSAVVFLVGSRAYKLKRAVRYDYLDFSTAALRHRYCEAEVAVNRRTAPDLYEGVVAVTRENDGRLAVAGAGPPVDWLVQMRRFSDSDLLDRVASRGALDLTLMSRLALAIARLHDQADRRFDKGGEGGMAWVVEGNERGLTEEGTGRLSPEVRDRVLAATRARLAAAAPLLEARRRAGYVRVCHGDLHLGNVVLLHGEPVLFDGVEFNDDIACVDTLYDLAFVLMDLWRLHLRQHASVLFNAYAAAMFRTARDDNALSLLPLFLACRSLVRAKTSATASRLQSNPAEAHAQASIAQVYLAEAEALLHPAPPRLVAIGGVSGTGKSTLARGLAAEIGAAPGALILRTDVLRKQLCGVAETTRLGPDAYSADMDRRVYAELCVRAEAALRSGHSVIVDGVFGRQADRRRVRDAARSAGAGFAALWLDAPQSVLNDRVRGRLGDASDATEAVLADQLVRADAPDWPVVDASGTADAVLSRVREASAPTAP